jgi:hypothetical protein
MADALTMIDPATYDAPWPEWSMGPDGQWRRTDGDAPESCQCDWCGATADLDDTTDGLCPRCHATYGACEEADNAAADAEDSLEQALCELAAARDAVAEARKAIVSARKAQSRALAAHSARYDG